jgi:hypothetical protein
MLLSYQVGTKRYDSTSGGEREIQRTMLELLNQVSCKEGTFSWSHFFPVADKGLRSWTGSIREAM